MIYNNSYTHEFMTRGLFILSVKVIIINNYNIIINYPHEKKYIYNIHVLFSTEKNKPCTNKI